MVRAVTSRKLIQIGTVAQGENARNITVRELMGSHIGVIARYTSN